MIRHSILEAIGETPLIELKRLFGSHAFRAFSKLEGLNPGGSSKDRPAMRIMERALRDGRIQPGSTVIESSSGNMAIGLAQVCTLYGMKLICVVDAKTSPQNLQILKVYGAEIDFVAEPDPETNEFLPARIARVLELLEQHPGSYWPNQYENQDNYRAHLASTLPEIYGDLKQVDFLFCPTSTCGTVRACVEYVRERELQTQVVAVDAAGSVIFGGEKGERLLPGMGAGLRPPLCPAEEIDALVLVDSRECVLGCRELLSREAIFCGASSGGVISAVKKMSPSIPPGSTCVAILPDRGERYLDTVFNDRWLDEHFGDSLTKSAALSPQTPRLVEVADNLNR